MLQLACLETTEHKLKEALTPSAMSLNWHWPLFIASSVASPTDLSAHTSYLRAFNRASSRTRLNEPRVY